MKAYLKILIIVTITFVLIAYIRDSFDFGHIARVLPWCSGSEDQLGYPLGSIVLLILMFWGFSRLKRLGRKDDGTSEELWTTDRDDYETEYDYDDRSYCEED